MRFFHRCDALPCCSSLSAIPKPCQSHRLCQLQYITLYLPALMSCRQPLVSRTTEVITLRMLTAARPPTQLLYATFLRDFFAAEEVDDELFLMEMRDGGFLADGSEEF